jgi:hypothetical protein
MNLSCNGKCTASHLIAVVDVYDTTVEANEKNNLIVEPVLAPAETADLSTLIAASSQPHRVYRFADGTFAGTFNGAFLLPELSADRLVALDAGGATDWWYRTGDGSLSKALAGRGQDVVGVVTVTEAGSLIVALDADGDTIVDVLNTIGPDGTRQLVLREGNGVALADELYQGRSPFCSPSAPGAELAGRTRQADPRASISVDCGTGPGAGGSGSSGGAYAGSAGTPADDLRDALCDAAGASRRPGGPPTDGPTLHRDFKFDGNKVGIEKDAKLLGLGKLDPNKIGLGKNPLTDPLFDPGKGGPTLTPADKFDAAKAGIEKNLASFDPDKLDPNKTALGKNPLTDALHDPDKGGPTLVPTDKFDADKAGFGKDPKISGFDQPKAGITDPDDPSDLGFASLCGREWQDGLGRIEEWQRRVVEERCLDRRSQPSPNAVADGALIELGTYCSEQEDGSRYSGSVGVGDILGQDGCSAPEGGSREREACGESSLPIFSSSSGGNIGIGYGDIIGLQACDPTVCQDARLAGDALAGAAAASGL